LYIFSSKSAHNKSVLATLIEEVKGDSENEFSKEILACLFQLISFYVSIVLCYLVAVKRKYEAERRNLKESDKGESFKSDRIKKAKYDQRKKRVRSSHYILG
jgi:mannitol-specific phosphotransferase system IIBC component